MELFIKEPFHYGAAATGGVTADRLRNTPAEAGDQKYVGKQNNGGGSNRGRPRRRSVIYLPVTL
jgi:hypothetical protein